MELRFDPSATRAYTARVLRRFVEGPAIVVIAVIILIPFILEELRTQNASHLMTAILLFGMVFLIVKGFITERLESDELPVKDNGNLASQLTQDILARLSENASMAREVVEAASLSTRGGFILHEMGISRERFLPLVRPILEDQLATPFLTKVMAAMQRFKTKRIDSGCILFTLFQRKGVMEELLNSLDLSLQDVAMITEWERYHHTVWTRESFFSPQSLLRSFGGLGRRWITGYNDALDEITTDISETILYRCKRKVTIHLDKIKDALLVLGRSSQHNIIVTGQDGSGKQSFVENLAHHLRLNEVRSGSAYTRVLILKVQDLLSGGQNPDTFLLQALTRADSQGRFIVVIQDIGLFLSSGDEKLRGVLIKFLQAKNINIIGIADTKDYHTLIKTDASLDSQFETIALEPTNVSDTMSVLMEEYFRIEDKSHIHVTYKALKEIIDHADRYIRKSSFPGKAIDLLHDTVSHAKQLSNTYVKPEDVRAMVSLRAHMDIGEVGEHERLALKSLSDAMHKHIVGQDYAIAAIVSALKRARARIGLKNRPLATFLFLGPTGVGKTETAKALAEEYFGKMASGGSKAPMIRLDMNEYSSPESVSAIIGSTDPAKPAEGYLAREVQDHPFSLILLDEIEKADKKVLNLFLQVLDEGHFIDAQGTKTDFRNTIIIATSNAGAAFITDFLHSNANAAGLAFKNSLIDEIIRTGVYSPEFLNRFDDVILYLPLTKEETIEVAKRMIRSVVAGVERERGIIIRVDIDAVTAIAEKGFSHDFGVREMRRAIGETLETHIADFLLNRPLRRGDIIEVRREDLRI